MLFLYWRVQHPGCCGERDDVREIRCENDNRFLARINNGRLEIFCSKCKSFHVIEIANLVGLAMADLKQGEDQDTRLFV